MNRRLVCTAGAVVVPFALSACSFEKSSDPLSPTLAGPIPGVVITAPRILQPANGSKVGANQLTFVITNATSSGERPLSYFIEVADDVQFKTVVFTRGGVTPGPNGQTSVKIEGALVTDRTYFWHARAEDGANTSPFSAAAQFDLFTPVIYQTPVLLAPINDATVSNLRPKFSWANVGKLGTPDVVTYRVELSDSSAFTNSASATLPEQAGSQTVVEAPEDLPVSKQLFWRVRAFDSNNTGPWSVTQSFKTPARGSGSGGCSFPKSPAEATTEEWRVCVFSLIEKRGVGPTVTIEGVWTLRPDLNAMGAEWQNGWRGDPRPRIFLPVPNCPSATNPSAPDCSYTRTVDMGDWGGPWLWIPR